ncbi:RNA uridylyltransferase [Rhizoctonia solani]|uniref:RNA uridylyltransferase n=1 Tax=Rhizoctonia solani TaxID=456999 RepID=A0A8H7HGU3_9AGAM|nr:RNA uridylyltransferase [Rhizoctonia solani]
MKAGPTYHPHLFDDIELLLKRHAAPPDAMQAREILIKQVQNSIAQAFGHQYHVIDLTFHRAHSVLTKMKVELAIVDGRTPDGALPPIIVTPKLVSTLKSLNLQAISDPATARTSGLQVATSPSASPSTPGRLLPGLELNINYSLPFVLTRLSLFQCYFAIHPNLPALFSVTRLWLESHSLSAISPTYLASLCISYLQINFGLPNLQRSELVEGIRQDELTDTFKNEVAQWRVRPLPLSELLIGWFRYFGRRFRPKQTLISIKDGGLQSLPHSGSALRILDPFSKDHVHTPLSPADTARFVNLAKAAGDTLDKARPLREVIGQGLPNVGSPRVNIDRGMARQIWDMYQANQPSRQTLDNRAKIIDRINTLISEHFGDGYEVLQFGSTGYGVDSDSSDLDLMIKDNKRPMGFSPHVQLSAVYDVKTIAKILRKARFVEIFAIPTASVPIVKCRDPYTNIKIDVNCNELLGLRNTELLAHYCNLYQPLRPLIFFLKRWAKSYGLNDPSAQTGPPGFSSYCLALMTVAYLQTQKALPSLQSQFDAVPANRDQHGVWMRVKGRPPLWCDTRWEPPTRWDRVELPLEEVVYGWFKFWGTEINYAQTGVDIRLGGTIERQQDTGSAHGRVTPTGRRNRKGKKGDSVASATAAKGITSENTNRVATRDVSSSQNADHYVVENSNNTSQNGKQHNETAPPTPSITGANELEARMAQEELQDLRDEVESVPVANGRIIEYEQPILWRSHTMLVVDPFIRVKNVAGNVAYTQVELFRMNCQRAAEALEAGLSLDRIMGDIASDPPQNVGMVPMPMMGTVLDIRACSLLSRGRKWHLVGLERSDSYHDHRIISVGMILNTSRRRENITMTLMPTEVIELIASQLTLSFKDVIAFSLTSRRVHEATAFLVTKPLLSEDIRDTGGPGGRDNTSIGLSRALIVDLKFTLASEEASVESEQLRRLLVRAPRLRYLALRRPPLSIENQEATIRWEPTRSKTSAHPFPLRTSHFQPGAAYLSSLTHLDLNDLSIHPMILPRFPNLTHLKLSLSGHQDAYLPSEVMNIISFAKSCKLVAFEVGMHAVVGQRERLSVVKACVGAWPGLRILNLVSARSGQKILSLGDSWMKPENVVNSATELAEALQFCPDLATLSLNLSDHNPDYLAIIFHRHCPLLETFGCLTPNKIKPSARRPFIESFELVVTRRTKQHGWVRCKSGINGAGVGIFGMFD